MQEDTRACHLLAMLVRKVFNVLEPICSSKSRARQARDRQCSGFEPGFWNQAAGFKGHINPLLALRTWVNGFPGLERGQ